jgi:transcriptional regulator with XRE-family HTH domain
MITPAQSRAARALINWSQPQLAEASGVSVSTIRDFETGKRSPIVNNLAALRRALEAAGVELTNGEQPGVKLRPAKIFAQRRNSEVHGERGVGMIRYDGSPPNWMTLQGALEKALDAEKKGEADTATRLREAVKDAQNEA